MFEGHNFLDFPLFHLYRYCSLVGRPVELTCTLGRVRALHTHDAYTAKKNMTRIDAGDTCCKKTILPFIMKGYQEIFSIDVFRGCTEAEVIIVHRGSINYYLYLGLKVPSAKM